MAPPGFRLDTLTAQLVSRLEPVRQAHLDDPAAARAAFSRIVSDASRDLASECRSVLGDEAQARRIEREAVETFLPRYARLAMEQSQDELQTTWLLRTGIPSRVVATALTGVLVTALVEGLRLPWLAVLYLLVGLAPVFPEVRLWTARRAYQQRLQELAEDMLQLQRADEALSRSPELEVRPAQPDTTTSPTPADRLRDLPRQPSKS